MAILSRRQKQILFQSLKPVVRRGWDDAMATVRSLARINVTMQAIEEGSLMDVVRALGISEARFLLDYVEAFREAYLKAGSAYMAAMPPSVTEPFGAVFDLRNPRAERFLSNHAATQIKHMRADMIASVRAVLTMGQAAGDNPRRIALTLAGRYNRALGRRQGGIIGLSEQMTRWKLSARQQLESGDPDQMRRYLSRARRDRRFDGTVQKAIAAGKPVAKADADKMVMRYSDRLKQLRAETIARTETAEAVGHASLESLRQTVEDGNLKQGQIVRTWRSAMDDRVRGTHTAMNGQAVGLEDAFQFPAGGAAMFPGDSSLSAPIEELINCRCWSEEDIEL